MQYSEQGTMFFGFIGVIILSVFQTTSNIAMNSSLSLETFGVILTLIVAWKQAFINVLSRKLKDLHFAIPTFYQALGAVPLIALYVAFQLI